METVIVDKCKTCEGHCCLLFQIGWSKEQAMEEAQKKGVSLLRKKDCLKFINWTEEVVNPKTIQLLSMECYENKTFYKCNKFIDGKCSVYNARPTYCKLFDCHNNNMINEIKLPPVLKGRI